MTRDIEKINRLADRIEECNNVRPSDHDPFQGPSFSMVQAWYSCGSAACIIGHNHEMHGRNVQDTSHQLNENSLSVLASELGITREQSWKLCAPVEDRADFAHDPGQPGYISQRHAAAVLRNLAAAGEVDWSIEVTA